MRENLTALVGDFSTLSWVIHFFLAYVSFTLALSAVYLLYITVLIRFTGRPSSFLACLPSSLSLFS